MALGSGARVAAVGPLTLRGPILLLREEGEGGRDGGSQPGSGVRSGVRGPLGWALCRALGRRAARGVRYASFAQRGGVRNSVTQKSSFSPPAGLGFFGEMLQSGNRYKELQSEFSGLFSSHLS